MSCERKGESQFLLDQTRNTGYSSTDFSQKKNKDIVRQDFVLRPFKVPASIQANLPFAMREKEEQPNPLKRAVILEPHEKKVRTLLEKLAVIKAEKDKKRELNQQNRL